VAMTRSPWLPHVACGLALAATVADATLRHRSFSEVQSAARTGPARDRIDALHVLACRLDRPPPSTGTVLDVPRLLADPDPRLREYALCCDPLHFVPLQRQREWHTTIRDLLKDKLAEAVRCYLIYFRQVDGPYETPANLTLEELRWYLDALEDRAPPR